MTEVFGFLFYRGIERWMVVLGGLIFGYLGYKLFIYGVDQGHGKLDAENKLFKITFSGSGPGLFFMAFGALILMSSVYSTGTITKRSLLGDANKHSLTESATAFVSSPHTEMTLKFNSVLEEDCDHIRISSHDNFKDVLDAYGNIGNTHLKALANELSSISDAKLQSLLPALEDFLCE